MDLNARWEALRALLYAPGAQSWAELVELLTAWPDAETLKTALDYLRAPLREGWVGVAREAPLHWLVEAPAAPQPLQYPAGQDPRLALCDQLCWRFEAARAAPSLGWGERARLGQLRHVIARGPRHDNEMPINVNMHHLRALLALPCWGEVEALTLNLRFPSQVARRDLERCTFLGTLRRITMPAYYTNPPPILKLWEAGRLPALREICLTEPRQRLARDQAENFEMHHMVRWLTTYGDPHWRFQTGINHAPLRSYLFQLEGNA